MIRRIEMGHSTFFFGPLMSRRLGSSLGIDLLPRSGKNCTLNCLYCEIGAARPIHCNKRFNLFLDDLPLFKLHLKKIIREENPQSLTFVGYLGEPTLNPHIFEFLDTTQDILKELKNTSSLPTLLSNSTTITDLKVQDKIIKFKRLIMKLDAADQGTFNVYNQPHSSVPPVKKIIEILSHISRKVPSTNHLILQTLMTNKNNIKENINALIEAYNLIKPKSIQLYSISRPPAYKIIKRIPHEELEKIKRTFERDLDNSIMINIY